MPFPVLLTHAHGTNPLTESVQRCSVAAEQLVAAEQMPKGRKKYAAF